MNPRSSPGACRSDLSETHVLSPFPFGGRQSIKETKTDREGSMPSIEKPTTPGNQYFDLGSLYLRRTETILSLLIPLDT